MGILIVLTQDCRKEFSVRELLTAVRWEVTDYCGPVSDPYIWTFSPDGQFIEKDSQGLPLSNSTWSLKNNDTELIIGSGDERIISLTKTELKLKQGYDIFTCTYIFKAIPL
jgi:hypothetical protein